MVVRLLKHPYRFDPASTAGLDSGACPGHDPAVRRNDGFLRNLIIGSDTL
jgi:hypothetical protein